MWKAIKKQFMVQWCDLMAGSLFAAATGVVGIIIAIVAMGTVGKGENYIEIGTIIAGMVTAIISLVGIGFSFYSSFQLEVGLGSTRKHFFTSFYLFSLTWGLTNGLIVILFYEMEHRLYGMLYPTAVSEVEMMPFLAVLALYLAVVLPMVGISAAVTMMRFGRIAFWIMWVIWMVGFLVIPRFLGAAEDRPRSVYGIMGKGLIRFADIFSPAVWMAIIFAAALMWMAISYRIILKSQVTG